MTFNHAFDDLMVDTVQLEQVLGRNEFDDPQYSAPVSWRCRVVYKDKEYRTLSGDTVASHATIIFAGRPMVTTNDRVTLPDGNRPPILLAKGYSDENGAHHTEIALGA